MNARLKRARDHFLDCQRSLVLTRKDGRRLAKAIRLAPGLMNIKIMDGKLPRFIKRSKEDVDAAEEAYLRALDWLWVAQGEKNMREAR